MKENALTTSTWLRLFRVDHWTKNLLVFFPGFFAGRILEQPVLIATSLAFLSFCLVSSGIYIFNDLQDIEFDQKDDRKLKRPIASGQISIRRAQWILSVMLLAGLLIAFSVHIKLLLFIAAYVVLNLGYSLGLKHIFLLDLAIISIGFLLRILSGGAAAAIPITPWLIILALLLSFFLGLVKRRDEVQTYRNTGKIVRQNIQSYGLKFIHLLMVVLAVVMVIIYIGYTFSPAVMHRVSSDRVYLTALFVILGLGRYLYRTIVQDKSGSPVGVLFSDHFLQLMLLGWLTSFFCLLYL